METFNSWRKKTQVASLNPELLDDHVKKIMDCSIRLSDVEAVWNHQQQKIDELFKCVELVSDCLHETGLSLDGNDLRVKVDDAIDMLVKCLEKHNEISTTDSEEK